MTELNPDQPGFTASHSLVHLSHVKSVSDIVKHEESIMCVRMDEEDGPMKRCNEAAQRALVGEPLKIRSSSSILTRKITLFRGGMEQAVLNGEGQSVLQVNSAAWFEGDTHDAFREKLSPHRQTQKPKASNISPQPELAIPRPCLRNLPIRHDLLSQAQQAPPQDTQTPSNLYNADVFEYLSDLGTFFYGSILLMHVHSAMSTVAVFNAIASETWIDLTHVTKAAQKRTGYLSPGSQMYCNSQATLTDVFTQLGTASLSVHWSLGHHQCCWSYVNSHDVCGVENKFVEDSPVDVFCLDIECAEDHRYFMWNKKASWIW
ncbi:hypothetical protein EV424DRAFT_1649146 [Suillus variegatus]|nr:hypothetical protein EV424DRAFT_1649146 [Suillus variegatus]